MRGRGRRGGGRGRARGAACRGAPPPGTAALAVPTGTGKKDDKQNEESKDVEMQELAARMANLEEGDDDGFKALWTEVVSAKSKKRKLATEQA